MQVVLPRFLPRWPFARSDEILWTKPPDNISEILDPAQFFTEKDIEQIVGVKTWKEILEHLGEEKSAQLRSISGQLAHLSHILGQQINARDRTLVGQSPILVVHRPVFNGNKATGVLRELEAHHDLVKLGHFSSGPKPAVFVLENTEDEKLVWQNTVTELCAPDGRWSQYVRDASGTHLSEERAKEIAMFVTKNNLESKCIVSKMHKASRQLSFRWGESPQAQSTLNGIAKGQAWNDFVEERTKELYAEVDTRMQYREILNLYKEGMVFRFRDISAIDFADKVVSQLKKD